MSKAIFIDAFGGPEQLRVGDYEPGNPGPGEALIRQRVMGVNYSDVSNRRGQRVDAKLPLIVGREGVGTVEAVGARVETLRVGDRVAYTSLIGGYAERRLVPIDKLVALPAAIDDLHAMPLTMRGMTAHYLLNEIGAIGPGRTMLAYSAAGGVGAILCQWGRSLGATVIGCASAPDKRDYAKGFCDFVAGYDPTELKSVVAAATDGQGVDVVFDAIGKDTFDLSLACLRRRGLLVSFGNASGPIPPVDIQRLSVGSLSITRAALGDYTATREELVWRANAVFDAYLAGRFKIDRVVTFPLEAAADAHRAIESRATVGPVLLIAS